MKEGPIPFKAEMVRAVLGDTKRQTRRALKQQPHSVAEVASGNHLFDFRADLADYSRVVPMVDLVKRSPYGQPGDRLWVREAWRTVAEADQLAPRDLTPAHRIWLEADAPHQPGAGRYRPPMFMPRWASRIALEVTGVRVERLQAISEADSIAEGITFTDYGRRCGHTGRGWTEVGDCPAPPHTHQQLPGWGVEPTSHEQCMHSAQAAYSSLWEQINGPDSWAANPWVWVVEFRRLP